MQLYQIVNLSCLIIIIESFVILKAKVSKGFANKNKCSKLSKKVLTLSLDFIKTTHLPPVHQLTTTSCGHIIHSLVRTLQVLVGHEDQVTCVAVAISDKSIVVSGSWDANLIIWDIHTGDDRHLLTGHLGHVTCVKLSGDGSVALSGSDDKRIIVWDTKRGVPLTSLQLHLPILGLSMSTDVTRVAVHLYESQYLPITQLMNTPAQYVKVPVFINRGMITIVIDKLDYPF